MRFTEHELTAAMTGAAKTVVAAKRRDVRKGKADIDAVWDEMGRYERYQLLDALGSQVLPVLVGLPDVDVAPGTRPTYSTAQVVAAVEEHLGEAEGGRLRRKVALASRVALVQTALASIPPRLDPDGLLGSDDPAEGHYDGGQ